MKKAFLWCNRFVNACGYAGHRIVCVSVEVFQTHRTLRGHEISIAQFKLKNYRNI